MKKNNHLKISKRNFYYYGLTNFSLQMMAVAQGIVSVLMIIPFGQTAIGSIGLGSIFMVLSSSLGIGCSQVYTTKISKIKNGLGTNNVYENLIIGLISCIPICLLALFLSFFSTQILLGLGQELSVVKLIHPYLLVSSSFLLLGFLSSFLRETLKLSGKKRIAVRLQFYSLLLNIALNYIFLFTNLFQFSNPLIALAISVIVTQLIMIAIMFREMFSLYSMRFKIVGNKKYIINCIKQGISDFIIALPIGLWNFSDYLVTFTIMILLGKISIYALASWTIASKIMTATYRIPQALCSSTLVYYSYAMKDKLNLKKYTKRLLAWTLWPSMFASLFLGCVILYLSHLKLNVIGSQITFKIVLIQLCFFIPYTLQHYFSELLIVDGKGRYLAQISAIVYFIFIIPGCFFIYYFTSSELLVVAISELSVVANALLFFKVHISHLKQCKSK